MKSLVNYLNFDGNARDAMTFYAECLGADLTIQSFRESGMPVTPETENRTIHARLEKGPVSIMASDTQPGMPFVQGNNFSLCIDCSSAEELERLFTALGSGGKVQMELQDTFWGARFGLLTDKFGVSWMFNLELPKAS